MRFLWPTIIEDGFIEEISILVLSITAAPIPGFPCLVFNEIRTLPSPKPTGKLIKVLTCVPSELTVSVSASDVSPLTNMFLTPKIFFL